MASFNESITAYFGGDTSGLKNAVNDASGMMDTLSSKVGDKLLGMRSLATTIATALGINITAIADNIARYITGVSKEQEAAFKNAMTLSDQLTALTISNARARNTAEENYNLDLQKQAELIAKNNAVQQEGISARQAQANLDALIASRAGEYTKAQQEAELALASIRNAAIDREKNAGVLLEEQQKRSIELEKVSASIAKYESEQRAKEAKLTMDDMAFIYKAEEEYQKSLTVAQEAADKKRKAGFDERKKAMEDYSQLLFDQKTKEEQLVILEREARDIKNEMGKLNKDSTLYMQDAVDLARIEKSIRESQIPIEKGITDELEKQRQVIIKKKRDEQAYQILGLKDLGGLSTTSLQAALAQGQNTLKAITLEYQQKGYGAMRGGADTAAAQDNYFLASQMDSIRQELKFRQGFQSAFASGGTGGALDFFTRQGGNALSFDSAISGMSSWGAGTSETTKTLTNINTSLNAISNQLSSSGIFPSGLHG